MSVAFRRVLVVCVVGVAAVLFAASCSLGNDCERDGEAGPCAGPRARMTCIGGEGSYHLTERACGAGQKCVERSSRGSCIDDHFEAACTERTTCGTLDCIEEVCGRPTDASSAWCTRPTTMPKPESSGTVSVSTFEGTIPAPPAFYAPNLVPSACGAPAGG